MGESNNNNNCNNLVCVSDGEMPSHNMSLEELDKFISGKNNLNPNSVLNAMNITGSTNLKLKNLHNRSSTDSNIPRNRIGKLNTFKHKNKTIMQSKRMNKMLEEIFSELDLGELKFRHVHLINGPEYYNLEKISVRGNFKNNILYLNYESADKYNDIYDVYIFEKENKIINFEKQINGMIESITNSSDNMLSELNTGFAGPVAAIDEKKNSIMSASSCDIVQNNVNNATQNNDNTNNTPLRGINPPAQSKAPFMVSPSGFTNSVDNLNETDIPTSNGTDMPTSNGTDIPTSNETDIDPDAAYDDIVIKTNQLYALSKMVEKLKLMTDELKELYVKGTVKEEDAFVNDNKINSFNDKICNLNTKYVKIYELIKHKVDFSSDGKRVELSIVNNMIDPMDKSFTIPYEEEQKKDTPYIPKNKQERKGWDYIVKNKNIKINKLEFDKIEFQKDSTVFMINNPQMFEICLSTNNSNLKHVFVFGVVNIKNKIIGQMYPFRQTKKLLQDYDKFYQRIQKNTKENDDKNNINDIEK